MASRLPSRTQVIELLDAEFARAGYEIEDVVVDTRAPLPQITVTVDGDAPLDADTVAVLSRSASALLDSLDTDGRYVLEVSSPGVDRPLTAAKHFRRAHGRKVELTLSDGSTLTGRIGPLDDGVLTVVTRSGADVAVRRLPIADVVRGVVQVEFSAPSQRERELAGLSVQAARMEAGG